MLIRKMRKIKNKKSKNRKTRMMIKVVLMKKTVQMMKI